MKNLLLLSILFASATGAFCGIPSYDPFADATASGGSSYATGSPGWHQTNAVGDLWFEINKNGTAGNEIYITNSSLVVTGLPPSAGNSIVLRNVTGSGMRISVGTAIPETSDGAKVFYSMMVQVVNVASLSTVGDYCWGVNNGGAADQNNQPTDVHGRVYFKKSGSGYQIGLSKSGGVQTNYDSTVHSTNETVFLVGSYEIVTTNASGVSTTTNDICRLWINPPTNNFGTPNVPPETLSILGVDANEATSITTFVIENRSGTTPNVLIVDDFRLGTNWAFVTGGPGVKVPPPASISVPFASTLSLTNKSTGAPLTYQWQFAGTNLPAATTSVLTVPNMAAPQAGTYAVVVATGVGAPVTNTTVVSVTGDPQVTTQPADLNLATGGSGGFSVTAIGTPTLTYLWLENGTPLTDGTSGSGTVFSGTHTATLNLSSVAAADNGAVFACAVTNGVGLGVLSANATLTVQDPVIVVAPTNEVRNYLGTASFIVVPAGTGPFTYQWYYNGSPLTDGPSPSGSGATISGSQSSNLTVAGVTYLDSGSSYSVVVINNLNNTVNSSPVTLTVLDPYIATQPTSNTVPAGATATFTVSAAGTPSLFYQWFQNNDPLSDGNTVSGGGPIAGANTATLTISSVTDSNAGNYYVSISGGSGFTTNSVTNKLTVVDPITIVSPPRSLVERVGDHTAFAVAVTGTTPRYQWQFNSVDIPGATKNSLVLSNINTASNGTYSVVVTNLFSTNSASATLTAISSPVLPLFATNLVIARVGDGAQNLSGATGNTIYLDQYTTSGTYVNTIQIPDEGVGQPYGTGSSTSVFGSPALLAQGAGSDAFAGMFLTLSADGQQSLCFAAYCAQYPFGGTDVTAGSTGGNFWRGLATVNASGIYSLAYTNSGLHSGGNHTIRGMITADSTNFWVTGQAGSVGGVKYANSTVSSYANGAGVPTITSSTTADRAVQIVAGNIVFSDWAGASGSGLYACAGLAEPPANGTAGSAAILVEGGQPEDFAFSPDGQTVYIADSQQFLGTNVQAGGIQRWDTNTVSGGWSFSYVLAPLNGATNGAHGLTVYFPPSVPSWGPGATGVILYSTTYGSSSNSLTSIVDNGPDSTSTVVVADGPSQALRGVRFGPGSIPVSIAVQPQSQTNFPGNSVTFSVAPAGTSPFFFQWKFNGTDIPGATTSSFTTNNISFASAGNYSVVVSNLTPSIVTSSNAVLTVTAGAPTFARGVPSYVETAGDHLALTADVNGTLPISAQWYLNNLSTPIPDATNLSLVLANVQTNQSGTYILRVANIFGTNQSSGLLTITSSRQLLSSNNLIVARIGDGAQTLSGSTGNTLYLDQYTTAGVYVNTIQIPDEGIGQPYGTGGANSAAMPFGSSALLVAGAGIDAPNQGLLSRSADSATINFAGYCDAYPFLGADISVGANGGLNWRGIGGVSAFGFYSLPYTNTGLYSLGGHHIHGAVTADQINYWSTGEAGSTGLKILNIGFQPASGGGLVGLAGSSAAGTRAVQIFNNSVMYIDRNATPPGLYTLGGTVGATSSSLLLAETNSPLDFAVSPDNATIYIADNSQTAPVGGIQRWDADTVNGGYMLSYTLSTGGGSTAGARSLTVDFSAQPTWGAGVTGAKLYVTTAESSGNRLISITDTGAGSIASTLVTASSAHILAGIKFGPAPVPVSIASSPQDTNVLAGRPASFSVLATGSGPLSYQWYFQAGGTGPFNPIPAATGATYTIPSAGNGSVGNYYVIVQNLVPSSAQSTTAALTLAPPPSFSSSMYLGPGAGFQLNFSGPANYGFSIWTSTNVLLSPIQSTWTRLTTNVFSGGADLYIDPTGGTNPQQFYIITVP